MKSFVIGSDHAGYAYKEAIKEAMKGHVSLHDVGTYSELSVDYPDFGHQVAAAVSEGRADVGVLICGSGNGVAITANKHPKVRAALCWTAEIASLARRHNDANVLCIPARFTAETQAIDIFNTFINTQFEGGRHEIRVNKICM